MKKLFFLLLPVILLVGAETGLPAQSRNRGVRTESFSVFVDGGPSWSFQSAFDRLEGARSNLTQPSLGLGVMWYYNSRTRIGLQYNYSRMIREQAGSLTQLPGGGVEGDVYKDLKAYLNTLSLTVGYNLLGNRVLDGKLSAYAGAGLGFLVGAGSFYSLSIKNEMLADGAGNIVKIGGHNEQVLEVAPAIPLSLSVEYAFIPQWAVSFSAGYRFVLAGRDAFVPKGQAFVAVGLAFHFHN